MDGAGLQTGETTIACGRFGDEIVAQVTSSGVRLCGVARSHGEDPVGHDPTLTQNRGQYQGMCLATWSPGSDAGVVGAAAVAAHGRVALALPRRGSVVIVSERSRPRRQGEGAVSYTHLTLPTILLV